jgi:hypothetical protein
MTTKIRLITLLCFFSFYSYSQKNKDYNVDTAFTNVLNKRFKGGENAFMKFLGQNLKYPMDARLNCRIGTVSATVKIRSTGVIDSILFKNEVMLGLGIEEEVARCLLSTKGQWTKVDEYSALSLKINFDMDESNLKNANVSIIAFGLPANGCPTNKDVINAFKKAKKKQKTQEAIELCEDILRRLPNSEEYKLELKNLKSL